MSNALVCALPTAGPLVKSRKASVALSTATTSTIGTQNPKPIPNTTSNGSHLVDNRTPCFPNPGRVWGHGRWTSSLKELVKCIFCLHIIGLSFVGNGRFHVFKDRDVATGVWVANAGIISPLKVCQLPVAELAHAVERKVTLITEFLARFQCNDCEIPVKEGVVCRSINSPRSGSSPTFSTLELEGAWNTFIGNVALSNRPGKPISSRRQDSILIHIYSR